MHYFVGVIIKHEDAEGEHTLRTKVAEAMERVIDACNAAGVAPGVAAGGDPERIKALIDRGFRFITATSDLGLLNSGARDYLDGLSRLGLSG